jgi:F-type H+-transporting ATPase subunit b
LSLEWVKIFQNINWTFVFNIINFALLLWLLTHFLYRPATAWLNRRRELEAERLTRAKEREEEAMVLVQKRDEELARARDQAEKIVAQAQAQAEDILREAREEARRQAQLIFQDGKMAADRAKAEALVELRRSYAELVVLACSQVLEREVRPEDHERFLANLAQSIDARLLS